VYPRANDDAPDGRTPLYTWQAVNTSTMLPVVEADRESMLTEDEARKAAADFLLSEADGCEDESDAEMLDNAAQELNYAPGTTVGGSFSWEVSILPTWAVETV
jgi:hypothetical protein